MSSPKKTAEGVVALFNASDDTIDMIQSLLTAAGSSQTVQNPATFITGCELLSSLCTGWHPQGDE